MKHNYYRASLTETIRYFLALLCDKTTNKRYFISQGLGLERRAHECSGFWDSYLQYAQEQQETFLRGLNCDTLTVLGAGRLYDLNLEQLNQHFKNIELVDADALCLPNWKRKLKRFGAVKKLVSDKNEKITCWNIENVNYFFTIEEITGLFAEWTTEIEKIIKSYKSVDLKRLIETLNSYFSTFLDTPKSGDAKHWGHLLRNATHTSSRSVIFSQNILSQIGNFWFGILLQKLKKEFSHKLCAEAEDSLTQLNVLTNRILYAKHFADLDTANAEYIFITTDLETCNYWLKPITITDALKETAPAWNATRKCWKFPHPHLIKNAEHSTVLSCLDAHDDYNKFFEKYLSHYKLIYSDFTLWHVKPPGLENTTHGTVNYVGFFGLQRINMATLHKP